MTVAEMFALPVGQRVVWTPDPWWPPEEGKIGGNGPDGLLIVWPDGERFVIAPGDDDVAEFAANLEAVGADEPVVILADPQLPLADSNGAGWRPTA